MGMKRYYFGQYGTIWSLSRTEAIELCKEGMKGQGHSLEKYRQLGRGYRRPNRPIFISGRLETVFLCLDYTATDWQETLEFIQSTEGSDAEP